MVSRNSSCGEEGHSLQKHSLFKVKEACEANNMFEEHHVVESARAGGVLGGAADEAGERQESDQEGLREPCQGAGNTH